MIRKAKHDDLNRIAEIEVFNYRLKFYPIFLDDEFYFGELQVPTVARRYADSLDDLRVWDDGVVKGFILVRDGEVKKLFVEPVLQGHGIGTRLLEYAVEHTGAKMLWALEKNTGAIRFLDTGTAADAAVGIQLRFCHTHDAEVVEPHLAPISKKN